MDLRRLIILILDIVVAILLIGGGVFFYMSGNYGQGNIQVIMGITLIIISVCIYFKNYKKYNEKRQGKTPV